MTISMQHEVGDLTNRLMLHIKAQWGWQGPHLGRVNVIGKSQSIPITVTLAHLVPTIKHLQTAIYCVETTENSICLWQFYPGNFFDRAGLP